MESKDDKNLVVKYREGAFKLREESVPQPGPGHVLIRVAYSTINPYDRIMATVNKANGFILGCDGCGTIAAVGDGVSADQVGKKVAFVGDGWAKYAVKDFKYVVPLPDSIDLTVCANAYVNPNTALAMLDFAKKHEAKCVISMAASSALGKQMIRLFTSQGIEVINVVRKDA